MFRVTTGADEALLGELLYEIVHWRDTGAEERPSMDALRHDPRWDAHVAGWGRAGDLAVVALDAHEQPAGAAWMRVPQAQSDSEADAEPDAEPSVLVAVYPEFRRRGVARLLLGSLSAHAERVGRAPLVAHVERANPATGLFIRSGYEVTGEVGTSVVMQHPR